MSLATSLAAITQSPLSRGGSLVALVLLLLCGAAAPAAALSATPNVLFIAVDDLRPEHGVFGGAAVTPRVDAFARSALTFARNMVQIGVCSPSRTSLLTGRYPDVTHITDLYHYFRTFGGPNVTTLPEAFRLAGHVTRGAGKIFHPGAASGAGLYKNCSGACGCGCGGYNDPPSWDGYLIPPAMALPPWSVVDGPSWTALDEATHPDASHPDGQTAAFISAQLAAAGGRPFFLAPGFLKPHLPFIFPSRFLDLYAGYDSVARDADPPADGPMARDSWTSWSEFRNYNDIAALILADNLTDALRRPSNAMPRAKAVEVRRAYLAAVSFNDACVGAVLDALTASGHDNDTTVVLWGDHGWQLGDHGDWAKREFSASQLPIHPPACFPTHVPCLHIRPLPTSPSAACRRHKLRERRARAAHDPEPTLRGHLGRRHDACAHAAHRHLPDAARARGPAAGRQPAGREPRAAAAQPGAAGAARPRRLRLHAVPPQHDALRAAGARLLLRARNGLPRAHARV